jgi:putative ATP-dependent endonuclease of OLD family
MFLTKVAVENFRGFSRLEVDLADLTVFIGENNTGKTSILDAIRILLSRSLSRRANVFDDQDYYLPTAGAQPGSAGALQITLTFAERTANEWPPEVVQALADAAVFGGPGANLYMVILRVTSQWDRTVGDFVLDWNFLDPNNVPIPRAKKPANLISLQQLNPAYYLSALRDAGREFHAKSAFWAPFLRNPAIPAAQQQQLEAELSRLNERIINADPRLQNVSRELANVQQIVTLGQQNTVSIDALPTRVWDMLSRAQVNIAGATGANLPITRHGAGTQSLAVIFLFQAFLSSGLALPDQFSVPILALEEPEAHLHPSAIRSLWKVMSQMQGQTLVATHSGDLLSEVALPSIRRFKKTATGVTIHQLRPNTLTNDELRKINFHVRRTRAELLFARCWLLGEGETEHWVFSETAKILGIDLEQLGIRIVDSYAQAGAVAFVKLADDLGIAWHCVTDGDTSGQRTRAALLPLLNGRVEANQITVLPKENMEVYLCESGFGATYLRNISPQKQAQLVAKPGDPLYWTQVVSCLPNKASKGALAIGAMQEMAAKGSAAVPQEIRHVIEKCRDLARI